MTHEYCCKDCGTYFQVIASAIVHFITCPNCHSKNIKRVLFRPKKDLEKMNV
jgi:Zn finger protein HypA/HybF involved in hydrogenase expression